MIDPTMITTSIELDGYRIVRNLGVVRGITVRSRSVFGNLAGGLQTLFGGQISIYIDLCEKTREEAFQLMLQQMARVAAFPALLDRKLAWPLDLAVVFLAPSDRRLVLLLT